MTVNLNQRHLASECEPDPNHGPYGHGRACGAWYDTECVWCGVEIHMHRKQWGENKQTCSARCRVARHRSLKVPDVP